MKNLLKSSFLLGGTELALVLISIVRSKYLAVNIGPFGLGLYGLMSSFILLITTFCGGWFGQAYIKFVAEYHYDKRRDRIEKMHSFAFTITCLLIPVFIALLFFYKTEIKSNFLSKEILDFHYAIFCSLFIVNSLKSVFAYYLNATMLIKETAKSKFLTTIIEFISIIVLVYCFNVTGFFVSILISGLISLFIFYFIAKNHIATKFDISTFKDPEAKRLAKYGSLNIFLLFLNNITQYAFRFLVLNLLNVASVGLLHATTSLATYLGILNRGADFTYVPTMSQNLSIDERNKVLNEYLRFNIVSSTIVCSGAILFSTELVRIFYTEKFSDMASFFFVFVIAHYLTVFVIAFQSIIIGTNNYKIHTSVVIVTNIIWIVTPIILMKQFGIMSIGIGLIIASIWSVAINFNFLRKQFGTKISQRVYMGIILSSAIFFISISSSYLTIISKVVVLSLECLPLIYILEKSEQKRLFSNPVFSRMQDLGASIYRSIKWHS
jgi:O-antigen/teichoic acid export membrane protein